MPEISVVVPVYKVEPYLKRCIDSILGQTYTDFQLILVDDGSPDNCGKICDEYAEKDTRIHVIHRENGGLSAARNSGIDWVFEHSYTEWITFIDSDDWVSLSYLNTLLELSKQYCVHVTIGGFIPIKDGEFVEDNYIISGKEYGPEEFWAEKQGNATVAWGKLYKTELFQSIRYPEGKLHEDEFTTYKLLFGEKKIAVTEYPLYRYYQSSVSIMRSDWTIKKLDGLEAYEEQMIYFKENNNNLAFKESEKLHTFSLNNNILQIKRNNDRDNNLHALHRQLRCFLTRIHRCSIYRFPIFSYLYIIKAKTKLFISVRYRVLKKSYAEQGLNGVFNKIMHRSNN